MSGFLPISFSKHKVEMVLILHSIDDKNEKNFRRQNQKPIKYIDLERKRFFIFCEMWELYLTRNEIRDETNKNSDI